MRVQLALTWSLLCSLLLASSLSQAQPRPERLPLLDDPMLTPVPPPTRVIHNWPEALSLLSSRSTDLRISADELQRAHARARIALGNLLPSITASGLVSYSLLPAATGGEGGNAAIGALFGAANYQVASLTAGISVVDAQGWNALGTTRAGIYAAQESLSDSRRRLLTGLANNLLSLVTAERVAELNRVGLQDALQRLRLADQSTQLGQGTALDLARARQDVEVARGQVVTGDESLRQSREGFGLALGLPEAVGVSPDFQMQALYDDLPPGCRPVRDVDSRPDLLAAIAQEDVAKHAIDDVWMQFIPTLGVKTNAQLYHINGIGDIGIWNIQGVLTVPIWDGGVRYGRLRDARAQKDEAEQQRIARERSATIEVAQARRGVDVAKQSREVAQAALQEAEKTDQLTRRSYEEGQGTSLELVTAASSLRQQQINVAVRDYDVVKSKVAALLVMSECSEPFH